VIHRPVRSQSGFTLTELMIAVALLGMGLGFVTTLFMKTWQLWKRSYDELTMQRDARAAVVIMARAIREASPGSVAIDANAGDPAYSRINFTDGRGKAWSFWQKGNRIFYFTTLANGASATSFLASDVATLTFIYPNFQDVGLIDVAITCRKIPFARANPIVVQLVERVMMRNP